MDTRTKWLLQQPTFWLGILVTMCATALAVGLVPSQGVAARVCAFIVAVLNQYGVSAAHMLDPPRKSLADMNADEREELFKKHPELRARWEAAQHLQHMIDAAPELEQPAGGDPRLPPKPGAQ